MQSLPNWLSGDFDSLSQQYNQNKLPHGLLFVGDSGSGSRLFIEQAKRLLLCSEPGESACGVCKSCQLVESGHHPDLLTVSPEGKSQTIKVDAVRNIIGKVVETAQQGGNKVVIIEDAHKMNINAANALLKVLEEPTDKTFLILEAAQISQMLPTIRSRCRIIQLKKPSLETAIGYVNQHSTEIPAEQLLEIAYGQPLKALELTPEDIQQWRDIEQNLLSKQDFTSLSQYLAKHDMEPFLKQVLFWVDSALRSQNKEGLALASVSEGLLKSLANSPSISLFRFRDYIVEKLGSIQRQSNLNVQLMAEEFSAKWLQLRGKQ